LSASEVVPGAESLPASRHVRVAALGLSLLLVPTPSMAQADAPAGNRASAPEAVVESLATQPDQLEREARLAIWVRHGPGTEPCPGPGELTARVASRLPTETATAAPDRPLRNVFVHFTRQGSGYRAALEQRDQAGRREGGRSLDDSSADCVALTDAVVLTLTLLAEGTIDLAEPRPSPRSAAAVPLSAVKVPTRAQAPAPDHRSIAEGTRWADLSAGPWMGWHVLPRSAVGIQMSGTLGLSRVLGIRLGADYATPARFDVGADRYGFSLTSGWLGPLLRQRLGAAWQASEELELMVGVTHAAVFRSQPLDPGDFGFYGLRAGASLGFEVLSPLTLALAGHVRAPLSRGVFHATGQAEPIWAQPFVGLSAEVELVCGSWGSF
jgi:hypothetical protein